MKRRRKGRLTINTLKKKIKSKIFKRAFNPSIKKKLHKVTTCIQSISSLQEP